MKKFAKQSATVLLASSSLLAACAYPRRGTVVIPAQISGAPSMDSGVPANLWKITAVRANVPALNRGGLPWDADSQPAPDCYVRVLRDGEVVWESPTLQDTLTPEWESSPARNVFLPNTGNLQFEVWDRDPVGSDPVGIYRRTGLPVGTIPGGDVHLLLEGGATLDLRFDYPVPNRGTGVKVFEVHPGFLKVIEVEPYSPAARAGIQGGDEIIAIGGRELRTMSEAESVSALSLAWQHPDSVTVKRNNQNTELQLDGGFIWLTQ